MGDVAREAAAEVGAANEAADRVVAVPAHARILRALVHVQARRADHVETAKHPILKR